MDNSKQKRLVYMDQDGNPEDIASMMMVLSMDHLELIGVTMTPADCIAVHGLELTLKTLNMFDKKIEVVLGDYNSPTQFPELYKVPSIQANNLPVFMNQKFDKELISPLPAGEFMAKKIKSAPQKVTLLVTGPMSHVARAFEYDPSIAENIEEIVFMGGAIDVDGNIEQPDRSVKSAEWNVYWDPNSARKVLQTKFLL